MTDADSILAARWVLPLSVGCPVIENGAIAIANGRIVEVGTQTHIGKAFPDAPLQEFDQHVLMPGLINAHGHAAMSLLRGAGEDMPLMAWLNERIWPLERTLVSPEFVHDGVELACAEQLRGGITTFADNYFYPEKIAPLLQKIGIRALLACPVLDFPMPGCASPKEAISKILKLHDDSASLPLITIAFGPHAPYSVSDEWLTKIAVYAEELNLMVHMHVHESVFEIEDSLQKFGMRPLARLEKLGVLGPHFVAVHSVHLTDEDIGILKRNRVTVVHCPESNLKLASGFSPVARLMAEQITVALGTDGAASNNDLDLFGELRSAALLGKAIANDPTAMRAEDMLYMATLAGAKALGMENTIGSLEAGKCADIIAIDLSDLALQPVINPIYTLVYGVHRDHVSDVWIGGKSVLRNRELLTINTPDLKLRVHRWQQKVIDALSGVKT